MKSGEGADEAGAPVIRRDEMVNADRGEAELVTHKPSGAIFAQLRLDGPRFQGGRLPVSALPELERYERLVRDVAAAEWRIDNPDRSNLPPHFRSSFSLTITDIEDGSAMPVLERSTRDTPYEEYYKRAAGTVDEAFAALLSGLDLPDAFDWTNSGEFRTFGDTLQEDEAIELRPSSKPIRYTPSVRREVAERLLPRPVELELVEPILAEGAVAGRLVALDAEDQSFRLRDPLTHIAVIGRYTDPDLTADLRKVLDSSAVAPVVRLTGSIETQNKATARVNANFVELFEVDGGPYSRRLIELATLRPGWLESEDDESGDMVAFSALDAARDLLRGIQEEGLPLPGIFPLEDGGVQLEWASAERVSSVEVSAELHFELFDLDVASRSSEEGEASDISSVLAFIRRVAGQ